MLTKSVLFCKTIQTKLLFILVDNIYSTVHFLAGVDDDALTTPEGEDSNSDGDPAATPPEDFPNPVYVEDDLTQRRAKLAFNARCLRRDRIIDSTWVFDTRIMVKDAHGKIIEIKSQSELDKLDK